MSCILSRGNYILSCGGLRLTTVSDLVLPTSQFFIFLFSFFRKCYPTKISANHKIEKKKKKKIWFWRTACVPWALGVNFKVESLLFIKGTSNEPANKRKIKVSRDSYTFCILAIYVLWKSLNHTNIDFNKLSATSKIIIVIMSLNRNQWKFVLSIQIKNSCQNICIALLFHNYNWVIIISSTSTYMLCI